MEVETKPVEDSVPKINNEVAVGEDLEFQRVWWKVERAIWIFFLLLIIADVLGAFGRGWLAKAHRISSDKSLDITYERIERFNTPSILRINLSPAIVHDGKALLWVSDSLLKGLGNQRVVPQPETSAIGQNGILYTFPVTGPTMTVEFGLTPSSAGTQELSFQSPGFEKTKLKIFVMP
ncbi:MAG TPA: hypothetical protein VH302_03820 [Bryobacteraceae bacterium]|jgi:hypothetical protein|nr:hypothetical protein [Bryobacteraceae bacterium]